MKRHLHKSFSDLSVRLDEEEVYALLDELCVKLGFCLTQDWRKRIAEDPPTDIKELSTTVFVAEGLDVHPSNRQLYRNVCLVVSKAFVRHLSSNASSQE